MSKHTIGVDIVEIEDLQKKIQRSSLFLEKIFIDSEIKDNLVQSIAGKIAAKEAIIKTGYISPHEWKKVIIESDGSGKPHVLDEHGKKIEALEISISHTKNMAIAVALYEKS